MDPYYPNMETFGPLNKEAGVDRGMHQFFGLGEYIDRIRREKGYSASSEELVSSTTNEQSSNIQMATGKVATLTIMYLAGRYAGSWAIETMSNKELNLKQKRSIGVITLISATASALATTKMTN